MQTCWMGAWDEIDWDAPRPGLQELIDSWRSVKWELSPIDEPDLDLYVDELASVMTNGGVQLGRWKAVEYSDVTHWFMSRNRLEEYELHRLLFSSASFNEALPDLKVPAQLDRVPGALAEQWAGALTLDGTLAGLLVTGGAYGKFDRATVEAKEVAVRATRALMQDRFDDFRVDVSHSAWTPWFSDIIWDSTTVLTDTRNAEVTVLCVTDTD